MDNLKTGMNSLSRAEKRDIENFLGMPSGYVLDFTNRTFAEFFQEYNIDIYDEKYHYESCSKANLMRSFLAQEPDDVICSVLSGLMKEWKYFEDEKDSQADPNAVRNYQKMEGIVKRLMNNSNRQSSAGSSGDMIELSEIYKNAVKQFKEAEKKIKPDPKTAVMQANSAMESIAKRIIASEHQRVPQKGAGTLVDQVLKILRVRSTSKMDSNIFKAASGLITTVQNIEEVRNNYTDAHGKINDSDAPCSVRAAFVVNATATVGYFLVEYYERIHVPMMRKQGGDGNDK